MININQIHGSMKLGDEATLGTRIYAEREFRDRQDAKEHQEKDHDPA